MQNNENYYDEHHDDEQTNLTLSTANLDVFTKKQKNYKNQHFFEARGQILFLHDITSNYVAHEEFAKKIDYYEYHAINIQGHGLTPINDQISFDHVVKLVIDYIEKNNFDELFIIGHGFGALVAAAVSAKVSFRVNKLIFISPLTHNTLSCDKEIKKIYLPENLAELCYAQKAKFANYHELVLDSDYQKDLVAELNFLIKNRANFELLFDQIYQLNFLLNAQEKYYDKIKNIPLFVIFGSKSKIGKWELDLEYFNNSFEKVKVSKFLNSGFSPFVESQGRYYINVIEFLNDDVYTWEKPKLNNESLDSNQILKPNESELVDDHDQSNSKKSWWKRFCKWWSQICPFQKIYRKIKKNN